MMTHCNVKAQIKTTSGLGVYLEDDLIPQALLPSASKLHKQMEFFNSMLQFT